MRSGRGWARAGLWRWVAVLGATAVALTFAATASAASAAVTNCREIPPVGFGITFSGTGFAPNAVVSAFDNGSFRGTTTTDAGGNFTAFEVLIFSLPSEVRFVDTAGNTAVVTVTECGGGGGGGGAPTTKDECKKDGYLDFTDPAFKNQGRCVSSVASKNK